MVLNHSLRKGAWHVDEDERCKEAVNKVLYELDWLFMFELDGELPKRFPWTIVSNVVQTRTRKQCRDRFINNLHPFLLKTPWTVEEDTELRQLQNIYPNCWKQISKLMVGRSPNEIKTRCKSLKVKNANYKKDIVRNVIYNFENHLSFTL